MATSGTGAVFFLGSRAHYQVLEQPNHCDAENGNTSTETIYQNRSVEELWPEEQRNKEVDANYNPDLKWRPTEQNNSVSENGNIDVKHRVKRRSSKAPLCDMKPAVLNHGDSKNEEHKPKSTLMSLLSSLTRRKKRLDSNVQYLRQIESVLNNCTFRESCRCLDCQSRYFECGEESDDYSSDNDLSPYSVHEESQAAADELDDDVFLESPVENDNTSTDLLLEEEQEEQPQEEETEEDKQLQMEVAASTSAMFNILLYHPFSCILQ